MSAGMGLMPAARTQSGPLGLVTFIVLHSLYILHKSTSPSMPELVPDDWSYHTKLPYELNASTQPPTSVMDPIISAANGTTPVLAGDVT